MSRLIQIKIQIKFKNNTSEGIRAVFIARHTCSSTCFEGFPPALDWLLHLNFWRSNCLQLWNRLNHIYRFLFTDNLKMETKVNLRGMIHLDQIEDLLTNLVHTVQSQHDEIVGLKAICADYMSTYAAAQKFNTAHTRIDKLEIQLNEVNRRCTSRLEDKE